MDAGSRRHRVSCHGCGSSYVFESSQLLWALVQAVDRNGDGLYAVRATSGSLVWSIAPSTPLLLSPAPTSAIVGAARPTSWAAFGGLEHSVFSAPIRIELAPVVVESLSIANATVQYPLPFDLEIEAAVVLPPGLSDLL